MDNLTDEGHVLGMLDRDQRTAKPSVNLYRDRQNTISSFTSSMYDCERREYTSATIPVIHTVPESNLHRMKSISHEESVRGRTSPSSSLRVRKNDNRNFWVSIPSFHRTLILGVYLSIITFPTTLAAPPIERSVTMSSNGLEKWMTPCGRGANNISPQVSNGVNATVPEMLGQIINQANRSYGKANEFKEKFANKAFKMDWQQLHNFHKSYSSYEWLPGTDKVPKSLGEHMDSQHLEALKLDDTLYNTYEYLQRIAVGLDQIVIDEKGRSGSSSLKSDFENMETYVLTVLCEIQSTMLVRNLPKKPDIQRQIFPDNLRNGDNTRMNVRNYIIFREYMNILEYVTESFQHLKTTIGNA